MPRHGKYRDEMRERAVLMVLDHGYEYGSQWEANCSVAEKLGLGYTTPAPFEARWREANTSATLSGPHSVSIEEDGTKHPDEPTAQAITTQSNEPL